MMGSTIPPRQAYTPPFRQGTIEHAHLGVTRAEPYNLPRNYRAFIDAIILGKPDLLQRVVDRYPNKDADKFKREILFAKNKDGCLFDPYYQI